MDRPRRKGAYGIGEDGGCGPAVLLRDVVGYVDQHGLRSVLQDRGDNVRKNLGVALKQTQARLAGLLAHACANDDDLAIDQVGVTAITHFKRMSKRHGVADVIGLSRSVAVEWAPLGIRINCVAPGAIETEGWKVYTPEARAAYPRSNPMMRAGTAWDIAEACVYLCGPAAKFVTGELLTVDGGGQLWGETWTTGKPDYFEDR